ncbi:MAG TPA: methyltransferase domain-containing protein [Ktedonobacterales bacterium]
MPGKRMRRPVSGAEARRETQARREYAGALYARPGPPEGYPVVVSHVQLAPLLAVRDSISGASVQEWKSSADLGLSIVSVRLNANGALYPDGSALSWADIAQVVATPNQCFEIAPGVEKRAITVFSTATNVIRSLMPTSGAPTMLVSGFSMHRIKGTEPWADTQAKIYALGGVSGRILDTTTGLGYTALMAARGASEVVTIELDPAGLEIARRNPWSAELFSRPNITQVVGDAIEVVSEFAESAFDRVIHDPPYLSLAGDLYSEAMYRRIFRVLRSGGKLFHYIGDPASQSGARVTAGVVRRLEAVGFSAITRQPAAFGVTATK